MNANIKTRSQAIDNSRDAVDSLSRASLVAMGGVSGLVGIWAVACLVSAMFDNGPLGLIKGLFSAVAGM